MKLTEDHINYLFEQGTMEAQTVGEKTTVAVWTAPNGFTIVESSSCIDPVNYDFDMGKAICMKRIRDRLWELEGYKAHQ
jgi:hypothetical protein